MGLWHPATLTKFRHIFRRRILEAHSARYGVHANLWLMGHVEGAWAELQATWAQVLPTQRRQAEGSRTVGQPRESLKALQGA